LKLNGQLSPKTLRQGYDTLAMKLHPDKGGNPLEFEAASAAYQLLQKFVQNGLVAVSVYQWEEH
jgi:curved DNA-binding protein CbpA